jgi:hypothetical protein
LNGERHVRFSREREVDRETDVREMVILRLERRFSLSLPLSDRGRRSKRGVGVFFGKRRISSPTSPGSGSPPVGDQLENLILRNPDH